MTVSGRDAKVNTLTEFEPGIYPDIPESMYHSGGFGPAVSISSTEAKRILDCPAVYKWHKDNPQPMKAAFDFGHTVHALILGTGLDIEVHDYESLRTKAAREHVAAIREAGKLPVSRADYDRARHTADAVLNDPVAAPLFSEGTAEQSIYARHDATTVWMRGRIDWATRLEDKPVLVDVKTTRDANPRAWRTQAASLDYPLQAVWYQTLWEKVTGVYPRFIHVLVNTDAPHLVSVVELDSSFLDAGLARMEHALDVYARCQAFSDWPAYTTRITSLSAPAWYANYANGDLK